MYDAQILADVMNTTTAAVTTNSTVCLNSSLHSAGVVVCTIFSLIFYFLAFFAMSVAVGQSHAQPISLSLSNLGSNCGACCGFMRDTLYGICFCFSGLYTSAEESVPEVNVPSGARRGARPGAGGGNSMIEHPDASATLGAGPHRSRLARVGASSRPGFQPLAASPDDDVEDARSAD